MNGVYAISLHGWTIVAKWSFITSFFDLLTTEEDSFEFLEIEHAVTCFVVLSNHVVNLLTIDLFAKLLHGETNILLGDLSRRVRVKLIEHGLET